MRKRGFLLLMALVLTVTPALNVAATTKSEAQNKKSGTFIIKRSITPFASARIIGCMGLMRLSTTIRAVYIPTLRIAPRCNTNVTLKPSDSTRCSTSSTSTETSFFCQCCPPRPSCIPNICPKIQDLPCRRSMPTNTIRSCSTVLESITSM